MGVGGRGSNGRERDGERGELERERGRGLEYGRGGGGGGTEGGKGFKKTKKEKQRKEKNRTSFADAPRLASVASQAAALLQAASLQIGAHGHDVPQGHTVGADHSRPFPRFAEGGLTMWREGSDPARGSAAEVVHSPERRERLGSWRGVRFRSGMK